MLGEMIKLTSRVLKKLLKNYFHNKKKRKKPGTADTLI